MPSVLLSNVMSLTPKIDEVRIVLNDLNIDLGCIVESWLQEHIHDNIVAISGYNLVRRDRIGGQHGGICIYVRKSITYTVLENLSNLDFEVIWLLLKPSRLPRGITNIIVGIVYHPPSESHLPMLNYLCECLISIESDFPSSGSCYLATLTN